MTTLEDLWYGNIDPHETVLNDDRHLKSMLALMGRNRDKLSATLTEQQKESLASTMTQSMNYIPSPNYLPFGTVSPSACGS